MTTALWRRSAFTMAKTYVSRSIVHSHPHRAHRRCSSVAVSVSVAPRISVSAERHITQTDAGVMIESEQRLSKCSASQLTFKSARIERPAVHLGSVTRDRKSSGGQ